MAVDLVMEYEQIAKDAEWGIAHMRPPSHLIRRMKATAAKCRENVKRLRAEVERQ